MKYMNLHEIWKTAQCGDVLLCADEPAYEYLVARGIDRGSKVILKQRRLSVGCAEWVTMIPTSLALESSKWHLKPLYSVPTCPGYYWCKDSNENDFVADLYLRRESIMSIYENRDNCELVVRGRESFSLNNFVWGPEIPRHSRWNATGKE